MTEFFLSLGLALAVVAGGVRAYRAEWDRARCLVSAFEAAHAARAGGWSPRGAAATVSRDPRGITARASCGASHESVRLLHLEEIRW